MNIKAPNMWSSYHPYIFHPLAPPKLSITTTEAAEMKYTELVKLLPNFHPHNTLKPDPTNSANLQHQIGLTPHTFKAHIFHLEVCPNQDMKILPQLFSSKFDATLPDNVSIQDPVGNVINMKVVRVGKNTYLEEGWNKLVHFYGLYGGGWLRMSYSSLGKFDMKIMNVYDEEICYPPTDEHMKFGFTKPPNIILEGHPVRDILNPSDFVFTTTKTIDFEEALGSKLKISKFFCGHALTKEDGPITIVDEYYKPWPCHLNHDVPDPLFSWVTVGWADFCYAKRLTQGKSLKLGVLTSNSTFLYYIPV